MKKFYCIILLLCSLHQVNAQQASLTGTYKVDLAKTVSLMEGDWKQKYDGLESQAKERANQSMTDRVFLFKEGGQVEVRWKVNGSDKSVEGSWKLLDEEKLLIEIGEQTTEYVLSRPSPTGLVLRNNNGRGFFNNLYLEKAE